MDLERTYEIFRGAAAAGQRPHQIPCGKSVFVSSKAASVRGAVALGFRESSAAGSVRHTSTKLFSLWKSSQPIFYGPNDSERAEDFLSSTQVITAAGAVHFAFLATPIRSLPWPRVVCRLGGRSFILSACREANHRIRSRHFSCPSAHSSPTAATAQKRTDFAPA